jgi:hypothetical protein
MKVASSTTPPVLDRIPSENSLNTLSDVLSLVLTRGWLADLNYDSSHVKDISPYELSTW